MIETARLILRPFEERDRAAMRALWADPVMTADLGGVRDAEGADAIVARHEGYRISHDGLGFWVTERRGDGAIIGYCGLKPGAEGTPIAGELEIGWSLAPGFWGQGYASEAARAGLDWGWRHRAALRIVAITSRRNAASRKVMERIGMRHVGDFRHPKYAADDPVGDSVTYAIERPGN
jgi:RimJ/RimL family protein N-acetyltransferase